MKPGENGYGLVLETDVEAAVAVDALRFTGNSDLAGQIHQFTPIGQLEHINSQQLAGHQARMKQMVDAARRLDTAAINSVMDETNANYQKILAQVDHVKFKPLEVKGHSAQVVFDALGIIARNKKVNGNKVPFHRRRMAGLMINDFVQKQATKK